MTHYDYLIIGGGMTATAAVSGIRQLDGKGRIGIITAEPEPPYNRPPLSKQLWTGRKTLDTIYHTLPSEVEVHVNCTAQQLDPAQKQVLDDHGHRFTYNKLLLATGSSPRRLTFGPHNVIYFRTVKDYRHLSRIAESHKRFAVIGGGFIGSEIAAALAQQGKQVMLVFPELGIGSRLFPSNLSKFLNDYYRQRGVDVLNETSVSHIAGSGTDLTVTLDGNTIHRIHGVHGIVAGIGVSPNTNLAITAGLKVDNGIYVNEKLQSSNPHIYAAGDVASYPDALLGTHRRVEHEDAANAMGRTAGRNMAGDDQTFDYSPMFYSDLFDLGYEAVGKLDSRMEMVSAWQEPYRKGIVAYHEDGRVRGVLLWNIWDKVDAARQLITSNRAVSPADLKGYLS